MIDDEDDPSFSAYAEQVANALIENQQMTEKADYLARGRRFENASTEQLQDQWAAAFKVVFAVDSTGSTREFDDLNAELKLRGLDDPVHLVTAEMEALQERLRAGYAIWKAEGRPRKVSDDDPIMAFLRELRDAPKGN